jgi:hypothetical protein
LAAKAHTQKAAPTRDIVRQSELQEVDLENRAESLSANIRRRLEAGAEFERGKHGVSTSGQASLEWFEENGGIGEREGTSGLVGLEIGLPEDFDHTLKLNKEYPDYRYKGITLA